METSAFIFRGDASGFSFSLQSRNIKPFANEPTKHSYNSQSESGVLERVPRDRNSEYHHAY